MSLNQSLNIVNNEDDVKEINLSYSKIEKLDNLPKNLVKLCVNNNCIKIINNLPSIKKY